MRKLVTVLAALALTLLAIMPLAVPATATAAPAHGAALKVGATGAALLCILPNCGGRPYCRASNGCWVCCPNS